MMRRNININVMVINIDKVICDIIGEIYLKKVSNVFIFGVLGEN